MRLQCFIYSLLFLSSASAQHASISVEALNVVYVGLDNPISVSISGVPYNKTVIKSTHGELIKTDSVFLLHIPVRTTNEIIISVGKLHKKDTIWVYNKKFRVRDLPSQKIHIGALDIDKPLNISALRVQQFIIPLFAGFIYSGVKTSVISYKMHFISNAMGLKSILVKGSSFAPVNVFLDKITPNDIMILDSVKVLLPSGSFEYYGPFVLQFENSSPMIQIRANDLPITTFIQYTHGLTNFPEHIKLEFINTDTKEVLSEYTYKNKTNLISLSRNNRKIFLTFSNSDSLLTIVKNDTVSFGKCIPSESFSVPKNLLSSLHLKTSDTFNFINTYWYPLGFDVIPIGIWETKIQNHTIAKGRVQYQFQEVKSTHGACFIPITIEEKTFPPLKSTYTGNHNEGYTTTFIYLGYGTDFSWKK